MKAEGLDPQITYQSKNTWIPFWVGSERGLRAIYSAVLGLLKLALNDVIYKAYKTIFFEKFICFHCF